MSGGNFAKPFNFSGEALNHIVLLYTITIYFSNRTYDYSPNPQYYLLYNL